MPGYMLYYIIGGVMFASWFRWKGTLPILFGIGMIGLGVVQQSGS